MTRQRKLYAVRLLRCAATATKLEAMGQEEDVLRVINGNFDEIDLVELADELEREAREDEGIPLHRALLEMGRDFYPQSLRA